MALSNLAPRSRSGRPVSGGSRRRSPPCRRAPKRAPPAGTSPSSPRVCRLCAPDRRRLHYRSNSSELEELLRRARREEVHQPGDHSGPAGLMARTEAGAVVAVEILEEQDEVAPVRIVLELPGAPVDRS